MYPMVVSMRRNTTAVNKPEVSDATAALIPDFMNQGMATAENEKITIPIKERRNCVLYGNANAASLFTTDWSQNVPNSSS